MLYNISMVNDFKLSAIYANGKILLSWNKIDNIDGYRIFRKEESGVFGGFMTSYTEDAVVDCSLQDEELEFKVKPFNLLDGKRDFSNGISAKCKVKTVEMSNIKLSVLEAYGKKIALSWINDVDVDGFHIFDEKGILVKDIDDKYAHIDFIDYSKGKYFIKGYKVFKDKIHYVSESNFASVKDKKEFFGEPYNLSVIIPVYNSQDYISRTIHTVLASTLSNIELILVDDESSDKSRKIIDWYSKKYPKTIRKIYKKNGGVADTRNVGINYAHGKYIAFMDNDDMIRPNAFSILFETIEKTGSDVVVAPLFRIDNDKYVVRHKLPFKPFVKIDIEDYLRLFFNKGYSNVGVWNKLYKSELVKSHPFGLLMYEDVSWTPFILSYAESFSYVNQICYEWDRKIREATFSNTLSNRSAEEKFKERLEAVEFFYNYGNQNRKDCLAYLFAKRMYSQGVKAKYSKYFESIQTIKEDLINNRFLIEDEEYSEKILNHINT